MLALVVIAGCSGGPSAQPTTTVPQPETCWFDTRDRPLPDSAREVCHAPRSADVVSEERRDGSWRTTVVW